MRYLPSSCQSCCQNSCQIAAQRLPEQARANARTHTARPPEHEGGVGHLCPTQGKRFKRGLASGFHSGAKDEPGHLGGRRNSLRSPIRGEWDTSARHKASDSKRALQVVSTAGLRMSRGIWGAGGFHCDARFEGDGTPLPDTRPAIQKGPCKWFPQRGYG